MDSSSIFRGDPSRVRPPCPGFDCGEVPEEDGEHGSVMFHCSVPNGRRLEFSCRDRSCGVLVGDEPSAKKREDLSVDPFFFDAGYYLAGKTGFQIWPGSRLLTEALVWPQPSSDCSKLQGEWQKRLAEGARVLELGAGIGVVGTSLAANGAQVLLTDLKTLVENAIQPNLERNEDATTEECPAWLGSGVRIGRGWAGSAVLDWTVPLGEQLSPDQINVDYIVACDCVWLLKMMEPVFSIISAVFAASPKAKLLMSYQRRDPNAVFCSLDRVMSEIEARRWKVD